MKALREVVTIREVRCLKGMIISKGTTLHIMKEGPDPPEPRKSIHSSMGGFPLRKILVVRVDNGTGHLDLMPETAVYEEDI